MNRVVSVLRVSFLGFLLALILPCAGYYAQAEQAADKARLVREYEQLRSELNTIFDRSNATCGLLGGGSLPKSCDMTSLCKRFLPRADKPILYSDSAGRYIPNAQIQMWDQVIGSCFKRAMNEISGPIPSHEKRKERERQKELKKLAAEKQFLKAVEANGDSAAYLAFRTYEVEAIVTENSKSIDLTGKTRDALSGKVTALERELRVKYSEPTRRAFVEYLYESRQPDIKDRVREIALDSFFRSIDPEWKPLLEDPFYSPILFVDAKLAGGETKVRSNQKMYQDALDRVGSVFEKVRERIVLVLEARKTDDNRQEMELLIKRVKTIQFDGLPLNALDLQFGTCSSPNAFYDRSRHTFMICPQVLQFPDKALATIIAHEIGHSIDPCISVDSLYSRPANGNKFVGVTEKINNEAKEFYGTFEYTPRKPGAVTKVSYRVVDPLTVVNDLGNQTLEAKGVSREKFPFNEVLKCLSGPDSAAARVASEEELLKDLMRRKAELDRSSNSKDADLKILMEAVIPVAKQKIQERIYCSSLGSANGKSQMQEAFSDWIAAEAQALELSQDMTNKSAVEMELAAAENVAFWGAMGCGSLVDAIPKKIEDFLRKQKCLKDNKSDLSENFAALAVAGIYSQDEHQFDSIRVNRIFFANPVFRKAMGCAEPAAGLQHCK